MKANLHWIKKLLQVSFVPAEIRPGKSRPEMYMVPPKQKPTSLHVLLVFTPVIWVCHKKKTKKPRDNQKTQRKTIFQDSCKSKIPKIKKTSRKPKKPKKTIFQDSCKSKNAKIQKTSRKPKKPKKKNIPEVWRWGLQTRVLEYCFFLVFLVFLVFSRFFWFLHFSFSKSPGILVFLVFLVFSRFFWFLHFSFSKSPGILVFLGFLVFLVFSRFFGLDFSWWRCTIY